MRYYFPYIWACNVCPASLDVPPIVQLKTQSRILLLQTTTVCGPTRTPIIALPIVPASSREYRFLALPFSGRAVLQRSNTCASSSSDRKRLAYESALRLFTSRITWSCIICTGIAVHKSFSCAIIICVLVRLSHVWPRRLCIAHNSFLPTRFCQAVSTIFVRYHVGCISVLVVSLKSHFVLSYRPNSSVRLMPYGL